MTSARERLGAARDTPVRVLRAAVILYSVLVAAACAPLFQTDAFIRGTVVGIGAGWLDVRHKSGQVVRVLVTPDPALAPGVRAIVTLQRPGGPFVAKHIRIIGTSRTTP